jgi:hypothetical protein
VDWPQARSILLVAFTLVNLLLGYSIWGPTGIFPELTGLPHNEQVLQIRLTLLERGFELAAPLPVTPERLPFLRIEYRPTLVIDHFTNELFGTPSFLDIDVRPRVFDGAQGWVEPLYDPQSQVISYQPGATGVAARSWRLENKEQVQSEVSDFLRTQHILPKDAQFHGIYPKPNSGNYIVEYFPWYQNFPVFSGYLRVEVSVDGIESISKFWIQPLRYKDDQYKAVRPAAEALLRLVGHLERTGNRRRVISDIRLGYYAGRALIPLQSDSINRWDTVPVWRIQLDTGDVYYINAFNGEFES